jgi:hypothetical protein
MRYGLFALAVFLAACGDGGGSSPPAQAVVDTTPPVISLTGDNPQIIAVGEAYVELGATASDNRDGDLSASIVIDASGVDSSMPGEYAVTYDVSDTSGNAAATVTRTVIYQDQTAPVITLLGDDPQVIVLGTPYTELGAEATDNVDGDLTAAVVIDATAVDASTPGDYTVTYDVTDAAGNAALTVTRTVTVLLPVPEKVSVTVEGDIKQLIFSWTEPGFVDYYRLLENADGHSGFTQLGVDIPAGTTVAIRDIAVHLFDWVEAQYLVEACNNSGCTTSDIVTVTEVMLDTIGYFKASDTEAGDSFGRAVALDAHGDTLAVTRGQVWGYRHAVHVYRRNDQGWNLEAKIDNISALTDCWEASYMSDVALSADGNTLAVGTVGIGLNSDSEFSSGCVAVFRFDGSSWTETALIQGDVVCDIVDPDLGDSCWDEQLGSSVALNEQGNILAAGAPGSTTVYMFQSDGVEWTPQASLGTLPDPWFDLSSGFGSDVTLSSDGYTLAVGAPHEDSMAGATYVYRFDGANWIRETRIKATNAEEKDLFGEAVALSVDGKTLVVSAVHEDSIATGVNGNQDDNSAPGSGAVYVFRFDGAAWIQEAYIKASNIEAGDWFGTDVVLSADGNVIVASTRYEDSSAIGIDGDETDNSAKTSGAAYIFAFDGMDWYQDAYVKAANTDSLDAFGGKLALNVDGTTLAIGAYGEDSAASGIDGDRTDNSTDSAGAVYIY